jgi:hypothetical protein
VRKVCTSTIRGITGNTFAASNCARPRDLVARLGNDSEWAALIYAARGARAQIRPSRA